MEKISFLFYLMVAFGLLLIVAAIINWEWYFKQRRAQIIIKSIGRTGARWLYGALGLFFAVFGYLVISGTIKI
nr:Imm17 family immunity protein [uncultured Carboxylicivirga sp.]